MNNKFYQDVRGSMTQYAPITPEQVEKEAEGAFTYRELSEFFQEQNLSIKKVIHDPGRMYLNTYYADFDEGLYVAVLLDKEFLQNTVLFLSELNQRQRETFLAEKDWRSFYTISVPLALQIYDFQHRYRDIEPDKVFDVWLSIYKRIDYANGQWSSEVLDYVFSHAPKIKELPELSESGKITIYRGMGVLSQSPEKAISWSTHPGNALYFANHFARGTAFVKGEIAVEDVIAYQSSFWNENEVIVRPGTVQNICYENMFPADKNSVLKLTAPVLLDYFRYGQQADRLGYHDSGLHGIRHILRVLMLSLIYYYNSGENLTEADKQILIYFSLLHDVGRVNDYLDDRHGDLSVEQIQKQNLRIGAISLTKKDYQIAHLIIRYHCLDDELGIQAIQETSNYSRKDKERAIRLFHICKDMNGLDRVRFNGLDYRFLRTDFAKRLPLIAGCLLKEDLPEILQAKNWIIGQKNTFPTSAVKEKEFSR